MSPIMEQQQTDQEASAQYKALDDYDWDNDAEFQGGLRAILSSASPDQASRLMLRARCYYFARKFGHRVDFQGYQHWTMAHGAPDGVVHESGSVLRSQEASVQETQSDVHVTQEDQTPPTQTSSPMGAAPPPASFAEICALIAEGKPIPGIKDIPDTVLEGQSTQSQAPRRKKPWEKDANSAPVPSWARAS